MDAKGRTVLDELLDRVIAEGIAAARIDYEEDPPRLRGSVEGLEACRGKTPAELVALLARARERVSLLSGEESNADAFFEARCFQDEVEWALSVLSAALVMEGRTPVVPPTAKAARKAADLLGGARR